MIENKSASNLASIKKRLQELRSEESRLEAENLAFELGPALRGLEGKTFAYRDNSRGGERFDSFRIVRSVVFTKYHAWVVSEQCQVEPGQAQIETHKQLVGRDFNVKDLPFGTSWIPCEASEYERAKADALRELQTGIRAAADLAEQWTSRNDESL